MFAQTLIDDFHLPSHFRLKIVTAINDQVTEYKDLLARTTRASALEGVMSTRGKLEEDEEKWWTTIKSEGRSLGRKAATAKILGGGGAAAAAEGKGKGRVVDSDEEGGEEDEKAKAERALTVGELGTKPSEFGHDEMRITVQVRRGTGFRRGRGTTLTLHFFDSSRSTSPSAESTSRTPSSGMPTVLTLPSRSLLRSWLPIWDCPESSGESRPPFASSSSSHR